MNSFAKNEGRCCAVSDDVVRSRSPKSAGIINDKRGCHQMTSSISDNTPTPPIYAGSVHGACHNTFVMYASYSPKSMPPR